MNTMSRILAYARVARAGVACTLTHSLVYGLALAGTILVPFSPLRTQPPARVALDPVARVGTLPNGLRYYLRHNENPRGRVDMALVVNAGSILEDDDQRGLAHFVEHVAFNGSTHFPNYRLWEYFPSVGLQIGSDVNASTSFDETIYTLTMPTEPAVLDTAFLILNDWAHGVTFDPEEIAHERGIIFEERRLHQGPEARQFDRHAPFLYGARYAARNPIGLGETILHAPTTAVMRFYKDWYRPDLETVVIVGDIDVQATEGRVVAELGQIPMPVAPRMRLPIRVVEHDTAVVSVAADPGVREYKADLVFPGPERDTVVTDATVRRQVVRQIFESILNDRLATLARAKGAPIRYATLSETMLGRYVPAFDLALTAAEPTTLERGVTSVMATVAQLARTGPTPLELLHGQKVLTEEATTDTMVERIPSNGALTQSYIQSALGRRLVVDPRVVARLTLQFVPRITSAELQATATALLATRGPIIIVDVPKDNQYGRPDEDVLLAAFKDGVTRTMSPWHDPSETTDTTLLTTHPARGRVVHQRAIPSLGVTEWTLSNGARILLKPTQLERGEVTISAVSLGGVSVASDRDYPSAAVASTLVQQSGLGAYDARALARRLADRNTTWDATIGADSVTASVHGALRHVETLFQLLYLTFTAPRLDSAAVAKWQASARRQRMDGVRFEMRRIVTQRHPRARPVIGPVVDSVDTATVLRFYRSSFADAGRFTFVIVGDFTLDAVRPLVEHYLGGLPGHSAGTAYHGRDRGIRPPATVVRRAIVGDDSAGTTYVHFETAIPTTPRSEVALEALCAVLEQRVLIRLRQQLNGVYSPSVACRLEPLPYGHAVTTFGFTSAPDRVEELQRALLAVLDTLATRGITPQEVHSVQTMLRRRREVEAQDNEYWLQLLSGTVLTGQSLDTMAAWEGRVARVTAGEINTMGRLLLKRQRYVQVTELPVRLMPMQRDELRAAQQW